MPTLKEVYIEFYTKLIMVLPIDDAIFVNRLYASQLIPRVAHEYIAARPTRAGKVEYFLDNYIATAFDDDGSNELFANLVKLMEKSDYMVLNKVAKEIKSKLDDDSKPKSLPYQPLQAPGGKSSSSNLRPTFLQLQEKFSGVADWESICPYLINDYTGQKTEAIRRNNKDVEGRRADMLREFLKGSDPTWEKVIEALRAGMYSNLAHSIEKELQGIEGLQGVKELPGENEGDMQQALALVLKDGVASSSSNTFYILGQENFGKSYIAASLLGNMFEEGKKATHDADVDVCKVFASKWSRMKKTNVSKKLKELYHSENEEDMQQALSLALKDGVASSSSITIYILGQEKAGKTCLVASLLGNKFEEGKKATHGADVDVCKVFASKWSRMEKTNVSKKLKELYHRKLKSVAQIKMSTEQLQPALHAKDKQEFLDSLPKLPEPVRADLEQAKTAFLIDEDGINVIIWDFAGQSVYHGLHSMFLKEDSVVMIVFDASQSLKDPVKGRDSHTDPYTQKCISPITTGCESVRYWLQSIHSIRKDGTMLGATSSFVPTIFLVATHVDLIGDADAVDKRKAEIIEQLILIFEDQSFANHLPGAESDLRKAIMKNCFFISNKVRNEKELLLLKDALVQATQYILNKEHPVVYLNIERNVLAINKAAITRDELHDIAQDSGFFAEPESAEFKGAVEHFHRKGTILHFPQTKTLEDVVVLSPDWLTKLFSYVIIAHPYVVGTKHSLQFKRLKKYGILEETCISFMVNKFNEEQERFGLSLSTEQAIEFAQMFGFIAEVNSNTRFLDDLDQLPPSKERVFIVPAMLPFDLPSNIELPDDKNPQARIIYFKFPEKFVPRMIFYQVLGACIDRNIKRDEPLYCIRRQMIKMVLGCEQIYYVSLCESHHSIRLAIVPDEDTLSSQSFRERWELIEELNIKLMEKVKTFMRASDPPQRYIPCYLCSKLHLTLDKIRANDKPLHCLEGGKLRKDYYLDLRRYEGVHQFNEAKVTAPTYPKLLKYFEKIVDWKAVAAHLLQDDDGSKSAIIKKDNHEVADCCAAMIKQYLQSGNVSWEFVLSSLEKANHTNLVKDIKLAENL